MSAALESVPEPTRKLAHRGTTNRNARGGSVSRRRRREWLVETYRANVDLPDFMVVPADGRFEVPLGHGQPACRCYRCGDLLTVDTVTADRIKPGIEGGTYKRTNIRPACGHCNSQTGQALAIARKKAVPKRSPKKSPNRNGGGR